MYIKALSLILSLSLILAGFPTTAFAETESSSGLLEDSTDTGIMQGYEDSETGDETKQYYEDEDESHSTSNTLTPSTLTLSNSQVHAEGSSGLDSHNSFISIASLGISLINKAF